MAINKYALIRYKTLDQCFRNPGRTYYIDDLIEECNRVLIDYDPNCHGVSRRTIFMDIDFMKSEHGWSIPLESCFVGKKCYYRYTDLKFSINSQPLNLVEADQLKSALQVLSRFDGAPQFEWVNELSLQLATKFGLQKDSAPIISFESNDYLKGKEHISELFSAISNKQVLVITYKDFKSEQPYQVIFHPHYLKQYNNRWFVFGFGKTSEKEIPQWNMALDRIIEIEKTNVEYYTSETNWKDYFDDFIGVSRPENGKLVKIELLFKNQVAPYVLSKPIHSSQISKNTIDGLFVRIEVIPNFELEQLILSFGESVQVVSPNVLKENIVSRIQNSLSNYLK